MPNLDLPLITGLLDATWGEALLYTLAVTHVTIAAVTIYLHRNQAHRALDLHSSVSHFFRFWLWLTTGMVTRQWVSIHRKHHARCETPDDPHSPQVLGLKKVLTEGAELYRSAANDSSIGERYGHGTPDDWIERRLYTRFSGLGIAFMLAVDVMFFGVLGVAVWAVQMLWIPFFAAGVINGVGHYWGYRNFESPDASTNISPWGLIIGGEELHNNHHAFPSSARFSIKPWEIDLGWFYIRLLSALGLAAVKKVAPRPTVLSGKEVVDMETLRAVVLGRMHVMAQYARDVLKPVCKAELTERESSINVSCSRFMRQAGRLLAREERLLDAASRDRLAEVLRSSQSLQTVYEFRKRLSDIWERQAASQEKLLSALQDWCRQAEATGIKALQDFSRSLRGYALQPV